MLYDDHPLHRAVAATMARFSFTRPVEQADLDYVAESLREAAPGCAVELTVPWPGFVRVSVADPEGLPLFGREYPAT